MVTMYYFNLILSLNHCIFSSVSINFSSLCEAVLGTLCEAVLVISSVILVTVKSPVASAVF